MDLVRPFWIWVNTSIRKIVLWIFVGCLVITNTSYGQQDCIQDTIPPFCFVESYVIEGIDSLNGGMVFFPEIAIDLCSEISTSYFFHVGLGKVIYPGDFLSCGDHIIQNIVSDQNENVSICRFKISVHCGEYIPRLINDHPPVVVDTEPRKYKLGSLSAQWESGAQGTAAISTGRGDPGGASYGLFQLSSKKGTLGDFLRSEGSEYRAVLAEYTPGTKDFNHHWRVLADLDNEAFKKSQYAYIKRTHYRRYCRKIESLYDIEINEFSHVLRDVLWSLAVQHGPNNNVFENAIDKDELPFLTEAEIIHRLYDERKKMEGNKLYYFPNVSPNVRKNLKRRYHSERTMALQRLQEFGYADEPDR